MGWDPRNVITKVRVNRHPLERRWDEDLKGRRAVGPESPREGGYFGGSSCEGTIEGPKKRDPGGVFLSREKGLAKVVKAQPKESILSRKSFSLLATERQLEHEKRKLEGKAKQSFS